jgi:hypothetical protein
LYFVNWFYVQKLCQNVSPKRCIQMHLPSIFFIFWSSQHGTGTVNTLKIKKIRWRLSRQG